MGHNESRTIRERHRRCGCPFHESTVRYIPVHYLSHQGGIEGHTDPIFIAAARFQKTMPQAQK